MSNDSLKMALYRWSRLISSITDKDEDANKSHVYLLNYIKQNGSLRQIDHFAAHDAGKSQLIVDHTQLLSDLNFEGAVDDFLIFTEGRKTRYLQAKSIIKTIIVESARL